MKTKSFYFLPVNLLLVLMLSCSSPMAQSIVGKWKFSNASETVEFTKEGIFRVNIQNEGYSYGMYELDEGALSFFFFDSDDVYTFTVSKIDKKELVLLDPQDGGPLVYSFQGKHGIPADEIKAMTSEWESENIDEGEVFEDENYSENDENEILAEEQVPSPFQPPKTQSASATQSSAIAGTWKNTEATGSTTLTLTDDYYFVRKILASEMLRDIYPDPQVSRGKYKFDGKTIKLLPFDAVVSVQFEEIQVENLTSEGFQMPFDIVGEISYSQWTYGGRPQLSDVDRRSILSWTNFLKLIGQWSMKNDVLKFMGDGMAFVGKPGKTGILVMYSTMGNDIRFQNIGEEDEKFFYTGTIVEFNKQRLVIKSTADGEVNTYTFEGEPKLNEEEVTFYSKYLAMQHRSTMRIIDLMDGVRDWIWVEEKKN